MLLAGLVLVIVGSLVSLGVLLVTQSDSDAEEGDSGDASGQSLTDAQAQREELMALTQQFVLRVNTFGPNWLDDQNRMPRYAAGVSELLTPTFRASFEQSLAIPEQQVAQAGYARAAQVYAVGVASMDEDSATVLVGWVRTDSYPRPGQPAKRVKQPGDPERWAVSLVRADDQWLVDQYAVISELPDAAQPSGEPSGTASPGSGEDQQ